MAMNANVVLTLDTRRQKKDETYPVILRLSFSGDTIPISTGYSIREKDWDGEARKIKKSYQGTENVTRLNNLLEKKRTNALDILLKLEEMGELQRLSINEIKDRIVDKQTSKMFIAHAESIIKDLKEAKRFSNARCYQCAIVALKKFTGKQDFPFTAVTFQFLNKMEAWHLAKDGNELNGLSVYMRTIRAIYNHAIKAKVADPAAYPFKDYKIKNEETKKRALDLDLFYRIMDLKVEPDEKIFNARNYFLASYMMNGMNFKDMAFLKRDNIAHGRLTYQRGKTAKQYDIKIFPALQEILDHYLALNPASEFVFPILKSEDDLETQTIRADEARARYNKKLKLLANKCDIQTNLTSYVSRHSFATHAMWQEVPVAAISAMLGHSSIKTTQTYLKELPTNALDAYQEKVMQRPKKNDPEPS